MSNRIILIAALLLSTSALAETAWVTDQFEITLRSGPSTSNAIQLMVSSGTPLEVLDVSVHHPALTASFVQINERRTKITVTFTGETRVDRESSALLVKTTSVDDPQVQVPVDIFRLKRSTAKTLPVAAGP